MSKGETVSGGSPGDRTITVNSGEGFDYVWAKMVIYPPDFSPEGLPYLVDVLTERFIEEGGVLAEAQWWTECSPGVAVIKGET